MSLTFIEMYIQVQHVTNDEEYERVLYEGGWDRTTYESYKAGATWLETPEFLRSIQAEIAQYKTGFGECTRSENARIFNALPNVCHERNCNEQDGA